MKQRLMHMSKARITIMVLLLVSICALFTGLVSADTHADLQTRYATPQAATESGPGFFIFVGALVFILVAAGAFAQMKRKAAWKDYRDRQAKSVYGRGKGLS